MPVCRRCLANPQPLMPEYFCACCRTPFLNAYPLNEEGLCGLCRRGANGFDAAYSFGSYEGTLRKLVHLFKYSRIRTLAEPLGTMLLSALPLERSYDVIAPMPMHWLRHWQRGFNQAALLARVIGRRTGIPVRNAARRVRPTTPQAGLSNARRRTNVAGAFAVKQRAQLTGRRVLLVDDVFTTGSTASACAAALKRGGAAHVTVLTLARTDRRLSVEVSGAPSSIQSLAVGAN